MINIEAVGHQLSKILPKYDADYIEVHLEENQTGNITYRGRKLESVNKSTSIGGNVRALAKGGWGFVSFNSLDELPSRVESAVKQAQFVGGEESKLAEVEPVVDTVLAETDKNPVARPLVEKKQLLDEYNDIIWATPGMQTSTINYGDGRKKTIFLNSAGSYIEQGFHRKIRTLQSVRLRAQPISRTSRTAI